MWPTVREAVGLVRGGAWIAQDFAEWSMMRKGWASLAPYGRFEETLDPEIRSMVAARREEILEGRFVVPVDETVPSSD
jgi:hypothetical protein